MDLLQVEFFPVRLDQVDVGATGHVAPLPKDSEAETVLERIAWPHLVS